MTETDDLTVLRSAVASFDEDEKLAFAGILGLDCASSFRWSVFREGQPLGVLEKMTQLSDQLPKAAKLAFAIELLQHQLSEDEEDEGDGLPDPDDYEEYDEAQYPDTHGVPYD